MTNTNTDNTNRNASLCASAIRLGLVSTSTEFWTKARARAAKYDSNVTIAAEELIQAFLATETMVNSSRVSRMAY
jgi:hypothetical protein